MFVLLSFQISPHKTTPICFSTSVSCSKQGCNDSPISSLMVVSFYSKIYSHFQITFPQLIFLNILPHPLYRPPFRNTFFPCIHLESENSSVWQALFSNTLLCSLPTPTSLTTLFPSVAHLPRFESPGLSYFSSLSTENHPASF